MADLNRPISRLLIIDSRVATDSDAMANAARIQVIARCDVLISMATGWTTDCRWPSNVHDELDRAGFRLDRLFFTPPVKTPKDQLLVATGWALTYAPKARVACIASTDYSPWASAVLCPVFDCYRIDGAEMMADVLNALSGIEP